MTPASPAQPQQSWWRSFNREQKFVFIVASLAWLFDCMDQQFFNLARDGAMADLLAGTGKAPTEYGPYTTSWFLLGWGTGGLIFGALGDRFGRARMLTSSILLYSICTGLSCLSKGFFDFCVYRFLTGVGVGGVFGLAVALVADTVPDKTRAPALGMLQSLSTVGNLSAGLIGMAIGAVAVLPLGLKPWQAMFVVGSLPALLCVVVMAKLKEPEKWVKAREAGLKTGVKFGSYANLLGNPKWRRNAWFALIACSAGIIGLWGIGNFHPTIVRDIVGKYLAAKNLPAAELARERAFWGSAGLLLQNIGAFFGMLTFAWLAQKKGRKFAFALALLASFLSTLLVFSQMREMSQMYWMLPLMGFGQLSVFAVFAIYLPELFPTSLRSTGTSFCYNVGRFLAATAPFTIGLITKSLSQGRDEAGKIEAFRTAGMWVSLVLLVGIAVLPLLPETKDKPLPEE